MSIVLTGGSGFLGQHVARRLAGRELVALDSLLPQVHADPAAARAAFPGAVVVGDVADPDAWTRLPATGVEAVVHLAAETGTGQSMYARAHFVRVNVDGTAAAAAYAERVGAPLVVLSSRAVYGEGDPRRASREDDPRRPLSVYGQTKAAAEAVVADLAVPVTVLRPQNVAGPGQSLHNPYTGVLAAFVARLREGLPLRLYGDGSATRDVVHVADVADLIAWAAFRPADTAARLVLNSGSGRRSSLGLLARWTIEASPVEDAGIEHVAVTRAGDITHACADLSRLRAVGAPEPRRTSQEAVADFVRWAWDRPGAAAQVWDDALDELARRGLTLPAEGAGR